MEVRQLWEVDYDIVWEYLHRHSEEAVELVARIERFGFTNDRVHKRAGNLWGVFRESELTGLLHFSNHGSLACHLTEMEILKKVVFLKTIRQYRPKNIIGPTGCVEPIYQLIAKSLRDVRYSICYLMFLRKAPLWKGICEPTVAVVDARQYDLNRAVDFLIESEKAFGRKPRMVNDLRVRIQDREEQETYLFLTHSERVVAQGVVEFFTKHYGRISGIYTAQSERGKGYGAILVASMAEDMQSKNRIPTLVVEKKNKAAVQLYEKLGFETVTEYVNLDIEWDEGQR